MLKFSASLKIQEHERLAVATLNEWLPNSIVDAHCHASLPLSTTEKMVNELARLPGTTFNFFPWRVHEKILNLIFPTIKPVFLVFGFPHAPGNSNHYLKKLAVRNKNLIPLFLASAQDDPRVIKDRLSGKFYGLKMYPNQRQKGSSQTLIIDVFPEPILEIVDQLNSAIVLHLPKDIFHNLDELIFLSKKYPKMSFVVAHMGNVYRYREDLASAFQAIASQPNIYLDTAMVADEFIIAEAIIRLGSHRVIFGTDAPFSYIRGRHVIIDNQQTRLQSQIQFNWISPADYEKYQQEAPLFSLMHLNIISSIKKALSLSGLADSEQAKQEIFLTNATKIFLRREQ